MKLFFNILIAVLSFSSVSYYSQSNYSLGITFGSGMNIYKNNLPTDISQFRSNTPMSLYLGAKLYKNLDEENKLFADLLFTRKKIEYDYSINEPEIPFTNEETVGQKYDCISFFVGYRRLFPLNEKLIYIEASVGADYNNNVMSYNEGNGEPQEALNDAVYFENSYNTNLGEKTYTISTNVGFGLSFGTRSQYDIGLSMNFPMQKIQSKESNYQYVWNYKSKDYVHHFNYIGNIYYPSIRFTYYVF